jgi:hypothetical protein
METLVWKCFSRCFRGSGSDRGNGNSGNRDDSDGNGRDGIDWEVEWMRETDSEEMMAVAVELGMRVSVEDI